jgi:hypothetical protein
MFSRFVTLCCFAGVAVPGLLGQANPTASRRADLQIGVGVVGGLSDYDPSMLKGVALYATLDLTNRLGAEFVIHQANTFSGDKVYERSYEIGPRYHRTCGPFLPYVKVLYGRGVFNFPDSMTNLAYNLIAVGGGADIALASFLNVRADYEYQGWFSFPPTGLTPQLLTIGVAYHVPGAMKKGKHWK